MIRATREATQGVTQYTIHKMQRVRSNIECERTWCQHLTQGSVRVSDALHCCVVYDGGMKPDEDFADAQL